MDVIMENILGLGLGLGLAAACGFRVFVPLFFVGLAHRVGHLELATNFDWMSSNVALCCFGGAMMFEVLGYYLPWFDNLLDSIATPAAVVAGTMLTMGMVGDLSPLLQWTLGIVAGGGTAAVVQTGTVAVRAGSTASTAGLGNPVVATGELAACGGMLAIAAWLPWLVGALGLALALGMTWVLLKVFRRKRSSADDENTSDV